MGWGCSTQFFRLRLKWATSVPEVTRRLRSRRTPTDPMPGRRRIMTGIVFGVQIDAGRADVGVTQVVADHFQVDFFTQVTSGGVTDPVRGCLLEVGGRSLEVGATLPQRGRGSVHHALDELVNGASRHRLDRGDQRHHQWHVVALQWKRAQSVSLAVAHQLGHQFARSRHQAGLAAFAGDFEPPALAPIGAAPAEESAHAGVADLGHAQPTDVEQRKQPSAARSMQPFAFAAHRQHWLKAEGLLRRLLSPVASSEPMHLGTVELALASVSTSGEFERLVKETDKRAIGRRGEEIHTRALAQLSARTGEAVQLARRWVALQEHRPKRSDVLHQLIGDLRSSVLPMIEESLARFEERPHDQGFGLIGTAQQQVARALRSVSELLDPHTELAVNEANPDMILGQRNLHKLCPRSS